MSARSIVPVILAVMFCCAGCHNGDYHEFNDVKARIPNVDLVPGLRTSSHQVMKVEMTWNKGSILSARKCEALILPLSPVYPAVWEYVQETDGHPGIYMQSGWLFLVGNMPLANSERLTAAADGSQIVLQVDNSVSPSVHRVFFLDGEKVEINKGAADYRVLTGEGDFQHFHEYVSGSSAPGPKTHLDDAPALKAFIYSQIDNAAIATSTPRPKP